MLLNVEHYSPNKTMKKIGIVLFAAFLTCFWGCKEKSDDQAKNTDTVIEEGNQEEWKYEEEPSNVPLNQRIDLLIFEMDSLKKSAFASEETKINSGEKLIDEIKQSVKGVDLTALKEVESWLKQMQLKKYSDQTMGNEEAMLAYDAANEKFVELLNAFIETSEDFGNHVRAKILYKDIMDANNNDFLIRKDYNSKVNEYNSILSQNRDQLREFGEKYQSLTPYVVFYGEPAS